MFERGINMQDIMRVIEKPDYKIVRGEEVEAYKKANSITLKVVYAEIESFIKVITVVIL